MVVVPLCGILGRGEDKELPVTSRHLSMILIFHIRLMSADVCSLLHPLTFIINKEDASDRGRIGLPLHLYTVKCQERNLWLWGEGCQWTRRITWKEPCDSRCLVINSKNCSMRLECFFVESNSLCADIYC